MNSRPDENWEKSIKHFPYILYEYVQFIHSKTPTELHVCMCFLVRPCRDGTKRKREKCYTNPTNWPRNNLWSLYKCYQIKCTTSFATAVCTTTWNHFVLFLRSLARTHTHAHTRSHTKLSTSYTHEKMKIFGKKFNLLSNRKRVRWLSF